MADKTEEVTEKAESLSDEATNDSDDVVLTLDEEDDKEDNE